jgi:hypothetical protein
MNKWEVKRQRFFTSLRMAKNAKIAFLSKMQNDSITNLKNFLEYPHFKVLKIWTNNL